MAKTAKKTKTKKAHSKTLHSKTAPSKQKKKKDDVVISLDKDNVWKVASAALAVVLILIVAKGLISDEPPTAKTTTTISIAPPSSGAVKLNFYVMSQCPFGTEVEDAIAPVLKKLGSSVDFHLNFIARDSGDGTFQSLHGQPEVDGDIVQLCAAKYNPNKYMDMIVCQNVDMKAIPGNWEDCAKKNGLSVNKIKKCYEGDEGKQLLSASIVESDKVGATGSPTIYLGGARYDGKRDSTSFQRVICQQIKDHPACQDIPACGSDIDCVRVGKIGKCEDPNEDNAKCVYLEPIAVEFVVLNDKTCKTCDTSRMVMITKQLFPGVKQRNVDIADEEGKKLVEELGITLAPAYLLGGSIVNTDTWNANTRIQGSFEKKGSWYKLVDQATGATHYVSEDERKKFYGSIGVTLGDNRPQIDFFVMSYCPYGNQAEEAIEPVYRILKDNADFNPHYVIYSNYGGGGPDFCLDEGNKYCSMHGIQELNQNIRELCVNKYLGTDKFFDFILVMNKECNSGNADTCWEPVAEKLGLDTAKIKACEKDEGLAMAKEELRLTTVYAVSGSPTVFIDGESFAGSRTAAGFQKGLCDKFDTPPAECDNIPVETVPVVPTTGSC